MADRKFDLTIWKLMPVLDDSHISSSLRILAKDFAGFEAGSLERQREMFGLSGAGHTVGYITGTYEHVTPPLFGNLKLS